VRTIRLPAGPGHIGKVIAVGMSPDGTLIASGGTHLYIFDRAHGTIVKRIAYLSDRESASLAKGTEGLPNAVIQLSFSPDGQQLAVAFKEGGIRIYDRRSEWEEVAHDQSYTAAVLRVIFASDGWLATSEVGGKIRLYSPDLKGIIRPAMMVDAPGGVTPSALAFGASDRKRLAVGDANKGVSVLDGYTLALLSKPNLDGAQGFGVTSVAWSPDDQTLFAAGGIHEPNARAGIFAWANAGTGTRHTLPASKGGAVQQLIPLPDGGLFAAATDPWLGRLSSDGKLAWEHGPRTANFGGQHESFSVSSDGMQVEYGYVVGGIDPARYDVITRSLAVGPRTDRLTVPRQKSLPVANWYFKPDPTLGGVSLGLQRFGNYELSESLAISLANDRFVLGTSGWLRAFDSHGVPLWDRSSPDGTWAVNISDDGRLAIGAYADGTIRWHRMTDGMEMLALMPLSDRTNWIAWTPEGFYAATPGARGILQWHINHGWDAPADNVAIEDIPGSYRPAVLPLVLQELDIKRALGLAVSAEHSKRTGAAHAQ
jgi:WD40 repeat protein